MKNVFIYSAILVVAVVSAGCSTMCGGKGGKCSMCGSKHSTMAEINTAALKSMVDSGMPLTLVDARMGQYDDGRRISNAINLGPEAKDAEIQAMLKSKDAMIVTYCANLKCPASRMLANKLTMMGYTHVLEYPQGIEGWVSEGHMVTQVSK